MKAAVSLSTASLILPPSLVLTHILENHLEEEQTKIHTTKM